VSESPGDPFEALLALLRPEQLLHHPCARGAGVRIAIIDSGIDRVRLQQHWPDLPAIEGALFRDDCPEPLPDHDRASSPHGTTVADIVLRLAPQAQLFSADVFGPQLSCETRVLIRAIRHAMDVWGCQLINLSLGIPEARLHPASRRLELQRIIEEAYHRDILVVAAASNDHPLTRSYPAVFAPPLFSVDRGLFADPLTFAYRPSGHIEFQAHARGYLGPFASEPATSWAAPHLTGIAARLLSLRPGLKPFEMKTILYWITRSWQQAR